MTFFLDTNICIYFLNGNNEHVLNNLKKHNPKDIRIPAMVKAELLLGALKSKHIKKNKTAVLTFLSPFEIVEFGDKEAIIYSEIRSDLEKRGQIIGPNDLIISSIVLSYDGTLVTNNVKEFKRIHKLKIINWSEK